jgi:hypothetical protein
MLKKQPENPHSVVALPTGNQEDSTESESVEVVTHDGQPVVTKEKIYDALVQCHLLAKHTGRDKQQPLCARTTCVFQLSF